MDYRLFLRRGAALALTFPLGFLGAGLAACGDSDTAPAETDLPFDEFPEAYRAAQCDHAVACGYMPDQATCLAAFAPDAVVVQATAAVAWGDLTYDAAAGKACVEAIRGFSCEAGSLYPRSLREQCDAVFGNRKQNGDACFSAIECEGLDAVCEGSCGEECCIGTCKVQGGLAKVGEICTAELPCESTAICLPDEMAMDGSLKCVAKAGANEPCVAGGCIDGYACDVTSAKCFQQAKSGAQCNPAVYGACAHFDELCDETTKKCVPKPKPGEACGSNTGMGMAVCTNYAFCDTDMKCKQYPVEGEPCFMGQCLGNYACDTAVDPAVCAAIRPARACVAFE